MYLSDVNGSVKVFEIRDSTELAPLHAIELPPSNKTQRKRDIPAGLAISKDSRHLYVCAEFVQPPRRN